MISRQAACTRLRVNIAAPVACGTRAHDGEILAARVLDPRLDARGDEALGGGDAHTLHPVRAAGPSVSGRPSARFAFCIAWPAAPLPRLSSAATTIVRPLGGSAKTPSSTRVGVHDALDLRDDALRQHRARPASPRTPPRAGRARSRPRRRRRNRSRAGRGGSAAGAGRSAGAKPSIMLHLEHVPVAADRVRLVVLEHRARERRLARRAARARDARLRVDDDARRVDDVRERREREHRGGRVAAGVRDQAAGRRLQLGQRVAPVGLRLGLRVLEAVPLRIERGVGDPVRAGEVDDDAVGRRIERRGALVRRGTRRGRRRRSRRPRRSSRASAASRSVPGAGRARSRACRPASRCRARRTSSPGWLSTRSSVSWPV